MFNVEMCHSWPRCLGNLEYSRMRAPCLSIASVIQIVQQSFQIPLSFFRDLMFSYCKDQFSDF